jgi:hypothetical protein
MCSSGDLYSFYDTLDVPLQLTPAEFYRTETVLGELTYCYSWSSSSAVLNGCFDRDGKPLDLAVRFGIHGPAQLKATEIRPAADEQDMVRLPTNVTTASAVDELDLPVLSMLTDYLNSGD